MGRSLAGLDRPNKFIGVFLMLPFVLSVLLLANFPTGAATWDVAMFFIVLAFGGTLGVWMAKEKRVDDLNIPFISIRDGGEEKEALDNKDFVVFGAVFVAILLVAILLSRIHPILSLIAGGFLLQYLLMKTQTIIIPWIAHALFNILVFFMATYSVIPGLTLYSTGIFIPVFSDIFAQGDIARQSVDITSTVTMQFAGVAIMEEMMKVASAIGIGILSGGAIGRTGSLSIGTILWIIAHTIQTYRV